MTNGSAPLGVFDSGVGGLSVVSSLLKQFPDEHILYVADQVHVPYGGRPLSEIKTYATGISRFLTEQGCRAIIMACNISSATALEQVSNHLSPLPVIGVIQAAATYAALSSYAPRIGVLATAGTVHTRAYTDLILQCNRQAEVLEIACPRFVPIVEAVQTDTNDAFEACLEYIQPLADCQSETIILGCTHYPFLLPMLIRVANEIFEVPPTFLDPATLMGDAIQSVLGDVGMKSESVYVKAFTTGNVEKFSRQLPLFLPGVEVDTAGLDWKSGILTLAR